MSQQSHSWLFTVLRKVQSEAGAPVLHVPPGASLAEVWASVAQAADMTEDALASHVASTYGLRVADLTASQPTALTLLPASVVKEYSVFPLRDDNRHLVVATSNPTDLDAEQAIRFASGRAPVFEVASPSALRDAIAQSYSTDRVVESILRHVAGDLDTAVQVIDDEGPASVTAAETESGPIVKLSNVLLRDAVLQGASDVHIQPGPSAGVVRFRVDGLLRQYLQLPMPVLDRVVSRIKVLGGLDIANRLKPQDGRTTIVVGARRMDLRISTVPTRESEKAVLRLLDPAGARGLDSIALPAPEMEQFRRLLSHRDGIVIVTGPTGSGKTTTMYAALRELATEDVNIMTVEDPIEYELGGITQIQVEPRQGVTFASALRAILRQDPDIIFIGEIRDLETAEVAVQASLTGHLVLATLHTNTAAGAVRRLTDLGLDRASVADTLRGVIAQRLVRRLCPACAAPADDPLTPDEGSLAAAFGLRPAKRAVGCGSCGQSGYSGRKPVVELFRVTPAVQAVMRSSDDSHALETAGVASGMRRLRDVALEEARQGGTTLSEVQRVIGESASEEAEPSAAAVASVVAPPASAAHARRMNGDSDNGRHALVVDDETTNRVFARGLLEQAGFAVSEAPDGLGALEQLAGRPYDLMILDLDMPRLAGYEVLSHVRRQVSTAAMPVIVLTGTTNANAEAEVIERGADDYLSKPIDARRFMARVNGVMRRATG
jgi:type II secretory ATPase GspE/PulE/Tfp pilus assembly ATPase PilB-like protein/ActR/RegA family two-component response regulator